MERKTELGNYSQNVLPGATAEQIRHIKALLVEQRKSLLDSLKSDLPAYLNYKFEVVASEKQLDQIRALLTEFGESQIPESLLQPAMKDGLYGYNWFFAEVIQLIRHILRPAQAEHGVGRNGSKDGIDTTDLSLLEE